MLHLKTILCLLLIVCCCVNRADAQEDSDLWNSLVQRIQETDFSGISPQKHIQVLLDTAEACHAIGKLELAGTFTSQALELANDLPDRNRHSQIFDSAVNTGQLELAAEIASESTDDKLRLLDKLAIAKYEAGDKLAIKDYPQARLDYHNAVALALAYSNAGEYDEMEKFVRGIDSLPSNEPTDVGSFAFRQLAMKRFKEGDVADAKKYIAIAKEIGGTNYYTGYTLEIADKSIHGKLTDGVDNLALRGAAYGGHHAKQLLTHLIMELVRTGHDDVAIKIVDQHADDKSYAFGTIARQQAERGDFKLALTTVEKARTKDKFNLNIRIAELQSLTGTQDQARKQIAIAEQLIAEEAELQTDWNYSQLARFYGLIHSKSDVARLIEKAESPLSKAHRAAKAMQGIADAENRPEHK